MQFPVPQFTDVEDKIIGPFTVKQFGIVFVVGILVFLGYSLTKNVWVLVVLCLLLGLPGLALAFAPFNGRPMYNNVGHFIQFLTSTKVLIFHKEVQSGAAIKSIKDAEMATQEKPAEAAKPVISTADNLKRVEELLNKTASDEKNLIGRM